MCCQFANDPRQRWLIDRDAGMKQLRVYLSSTFEDLKDHRAAVFAALETAGLDIARMEGYTYTAADERPLDYCLRDVAHSDIFSRSHLMDARLFPRQPTISSSSGT